MDSFGKYQVLELIGEGGFGKVWKGYDPGLKRYVAIKAVSITASQAKERFVREAEIAANLHHPAIITIHDFGEQDGVPYLVQEFLSGEDLAHKIARRDAGDLRRRVGWLMQVADGLHYAHTLGVIHRDIKPSNIRILSDGSVRIMDFGIAKLIDAEQKLTGTSLSVGTSGYVSPEALEGRAIDHRADIFSFGVMAYELITYRRPFDGPTVQSTLYRILTDDPEPIASIAPDCPQALIDVVDRCMRKQRDARYVDLAEVETELRAVFDPKPATTRVAPSPVAPTQALSSKPGPPTAPKSVAQPPTSPSDFRVEPTVEVGTGRQKFGILATAVVLLAAVAWAGTAIVGRFRDDPGPDDDGPPPIVIDSATADSLRLAQADSLSAPTDSFPPVDSTGRGGGDSPGPGGGGNARPSNGGGSGGSGGSGGGQSGGETPQGGGEVQIDPARVLVMIRGQGDAVSTAETTVLNELMSGGRPVVDPGAIDGLRADAAAMQALAGGANPAAGVGRSYGAGLVVVAELTTGTADGVGGFVTGSAVLNARFYDSVSGSLVLSERYQIGAGGVPGRSAATETAAVSQAAESVARQLARAILRRGG